MQSIDTIERIQRRGNHIDKRTWQTCIRRKIDEMKITKFGKEKNKMRPNRGVQHYDGKRNNIWALKLFEINIYNRIRGYSTGTSYRTKTRTLAKRFRKS